MSDIQFQNMDTWRGGGNKYGLTFKDIVIQHINRCVINGSVEFHGGYWKTVPQGNYTIDVYVPNTREVYNNSIKMLRACLFINFDDKMRKADERLKKEYEDKHKEFLKKSDEDNNLKSEWYSYQTDWYIRLFEELLLLSKRLNFFEEQVTEEIM